LTNTRRFDIFENMKAKDAVEALGALAQESRLDVFRLLVKRGPSGLPAGAISDKLGIPAPTLSFHLTQLSRAGLVKSQRESRSIIYSADYEGFQQLISFLMENCCQGTNNE
jgi:ArsR family transcriptional regulator